MDRSGHYVPYLAKSWDWLSPTTCEFELDPRFRFHDGAKVEANDVIATYRFVLDPSNGSPRRGALKGVQSVDSPAPGRIRFTLNSKDASFLHAATLGVLPSSQATNPELADEDLNGAGPYRIDRWNDAVSITLKASTAFPFDPPKIETIVVRLVPDALMRAMELQHGSIDFVQNAIDPDTVDWLVERDEKLAVYRGPSNNFQYLGMNLEHETLANRRVRRAIALAIDRQAVVRYLLKDQAALADSLLAPTHWAYEASKRSLDYNPRRARRLLDRAGFADPDGNGPQPRFRLSYKTTTVELRRRIAEVFAEQLKAVGIELEILTYEWGTFFDHVKRGNFHLYSLQWVGVVDPDLLREILHSESIPPAGKNRGRFRHEKIDRLTARGKVELVQEKRARIYKRVQRIVARELPFIPLWWPERVVVADKKLQNFTPAPGGHLYDLVFASIAKWDAE